MTDKSSCEMLRDENRIVLAYQNLTELPTGIINKYGDWIEGLDLSHNKINDMAFLSKFIKLTTLILDHNELSSETEFPCHNTLHTLWINNNNLTELSPFIHKLSRSFPNLRYLSMMKNPATLCSFGTEPYAQYIIYRHFVVSYFPKLTRLDDQNVYYQERKEASYQLQNLQLLQSLLPITPSYPISRLNHIV